MLREPVPSPCNKVCVLGPDGLCLGCLRSSAEIAAWSSASEEQKRDILQCVSRRRQQLQPPASID